MSVLSLTNSVNFARGVISGRVEPILGLSPSMLVLASLIWTIIVTVLFFVVSINLMKKRLTA